MNKKHMIQFTDKPRLYCADDLLGTREQRSFEVAKRPLLNLASSVVTHLTQHTQTKDSTNQVRPGRFFFFKRWSALILYYPNIEQGHMCLVLCQIWLKSFISSYNI